MENTNGIGKIGFFRRLKIAIIDLEDYLLFIPERFSKALGFVIKMALILAIILTTAEVANIIVKYGSMADCVDKEIPDFTYSNSELKVVDEKEKNSEEIILMQNLINSAGIPIGDFTKADLVNGLKNIPMESYVVGAIMYGLINMLDLFLYWCMTGLLLVVLAYLLLFFSKIKIRFRAIYALSLYASTLSIILTVVYAILNTCFGIYIDIFDYIFIIIAYIYISAVILMIKSELIKQQIELIRIVNVQKEVKKEMEEKEEDRKKDDQKEKDKEKEDKKETNKGNEDGKKENENDMPDEPDGSEI